MLRSKHIERRLKDIEDFLLEQYREGREEKKRDWRTYEQRLTYRIKEAIRNLEPLIDEATRPIKTYRGKGKRPGLDPKQKITLLLMKELFKRSNRSMASMLAAFSLLSGIDVSYKSVERLYSDPEVEMAIHNLHVLILRKKGVREADTSGDGTGYSLTIRKHYASEAAKRKDEAKETTSNNGSGNKEKMAFAYSFKLMDLESKMYVCYGTSLKSEKDAFDKALAMLKDTGTEIESVRLDRYYGFPSYVDRFEGTRVYVMPRKNSTLRGSWKWKKTMREFVDNTHAYLEQYYLRNNSESGFSADKRWFGWKVEQKREDRIDTALACTNIWHNLFNLY